MIVCDQITPSFFSYGETFHVFGTFFDLFFRWFVRKGIRKEPKITLFCLGGYKNHFTISANIDKDHQTKTHLELALAWNRADIAHSDILTDDVTVKDEDLMKICLKALKEVRLDRITHRSLLYELLVILLRVELIFKVFRFFFFCIQYYWALMWLWNLKCGVVEKENDQNETGKKQVENEMKKNVLMKRMHVIEGNGQVWWKQWPYTKSGQLRRREINGLKMRWWWWLKTF